MIPTRKTSPGAISSILTNIDAIVKAKLGIGAQPQEQQQAAPQGGQVFNFDAQGNLVQ